MRRLLFLLTALYTILLIIRPHEFVTSLATSPLLQSTLLAGFGLWLFTPNKGTDLAQFKIIPAFLFCVWLSLGIGLGWWGGIVPALERLVPPILLFVIITGCVRSVSELKVYSLIVIACACILVLHGYYQTVDGTGWTGSSMIKGRITYSGIFNDPNDIGLLIVLSLALVNFQLQVQESRLSRLVMWLALIWLLYGVYLTDSRGTLLAVMTIFGLEVWRRYGKAVVLFSGSVAVAMLVAYTRLSELSEASAENRVHAWYEGMQMLVSNPLFGVGWGVFSDHNFGLTAHNSLVLAMAELGLVGYFFWVGLVLLSGLMIYELTRIGISRPDEHGAGDEPHTWNGRDRDLDRGFQTARSGLAMAKDVKTDKTGMSGWAGATTPAVSAPPLVVSDSARSTDSDEVLAARSLLLAAIGFMVGAFFLSQSYKAMLFINIGLIVGRYLGMREAGIAVPKFGLLNLIPVVFGATIVSTIGMWMLVKVLL